MYKAPKYKKDGSPDMRYKGNRADENIIATRLVFFVIAGISFIPFLLITLLYTSHLKHQYLSKTSRRVNDISLVKPALMKCFIWSGIWSSIFLTLLYFSAPTFVLVISGLSIFWFNTIMSRWLAIVYFGAVVDPSKDKVYFRQDQMSYDFMDYVSLKFFRDLEKLDSVKISEIEKISKQYGDFTYIIGDFGSRRLMFDNKMKRDELIHILRKNGTSSMLFDFDIQ